MASITFHGRFVHSTDTNGRIVMPMRFRSYLGDPFCIVGGPDKRLLVMSKERFEELAERVMESSSHRLQSVYHRQLDALRHGFIGRTEDGTTDSQGRMQIIESHREYAGIEPKSEVVIIGVGAWVEVWGKANWDAFQKNLDAEFIREAGMAIDDLLNQQLRGQDDAGVSQAGSASADDRDA